MNKTVIGLFNDELGGRIMKKFVGLRPRFQDFKLLAELQHIHI